MLPLGVMAPETFQSATLEEYGRPYPRPVMDGKALNVKHHPFVVHEIFFPSPEMKKGVPNPLVRGKFRTP